MRSNQPDKSASAGTPGPRYGAATRAGCVDRDNVLDLLEVVANERRVDAAAAVLARDPAEREWYRTKAHEAAALLADVRKGLASAAHQHVSPRERSLEMERCVARLIAGRNGPAANRHLRATPRTGASHARQNTYSDAPATPAITQAPRARFSGRRDPDRERHHERRTDIPD